MKLSLGALLAVCSLAACASENDPPDSGDGNDAGVVADTGNALDADAPDQGAADAEADAGLPDATPMDAEPPDLGSVDVGPLTLTSPALAPNGVIPDRHACAGVDLQPELAWTGVPNGTQSLALVLIDDTINFVHWIAYNMPPGTMGLVEGASDNMTLPTGTVEADAYCIQFCGPCPGNTHTYSFRLYALDTPTITFNWPATIRANHLMTAFGARTLARADLTGTFTP